MLFSSLCILCWVSCFCGLAFIQVLLIEKLSVTSPTIFLFALILRDLVKLNQFSPFDLWNPKLWQQRLQSANSYSQWSFLVKRASTCNFQVSKSFHRGLSLMIMVFELILEIITRFAGTFLTNCAHNLLGYFAVVKSNKLQYWIKLSFKLNLCNWQLKSFYQVNI